MGNQGKFGEAISEFEETIEINPDFPEAYMTLALAYENKGEKEKAIENYEKFVDLAARNMSRYKNLVSDAKSRIENLEKGQG